MTKIKRERSNSGLLVLLSVLGGGVLLLMSCCMGGIWFLGRAVEKTEERRAAESAAKEAEKRGPLGLLREIEEIIAERNAVASGNNGFQIEESKSRYTRKMQALLGREFDWEMKIGSVQVDGACEVSFVRERSRGYPVDGQFSQLVTFDEVQLKAFDPEPFGPEVLGGGPEMLAGPDTEEIKFRPPPPPPGAETQSCNRPAQASLPQASPKNTSPASSRHDGYAVCARTQDWRSSARYGDYKRDFQDRARREIQR